MPSSVRAAVTDHILELGGRFFGKTGGRPHLAVRMRIRAAHCGAFVFKDLHEAVLGGSFCSGSLQAPRWVACVRGGVHEWRPRGQVRGVYLCPGLYYGDYLGRFKVREGEVMEGGKRYHVAFAGHRLGAKKGGCRRYACQCLFA